MRTKRVLLTPFAAGIALVALFALIASLTSAQLAQATPPLQIEEAADPQTLAPAESVPPVTFPAGDWPFYAHDAISVHPEPPEAYRPTRICAEVVNHTGEFQAAELEFSVATFGIRVPFTPVGGVVVEAPPWGAAQGCVTWVPPEPRHWCLQVRLFVGEHEPQISQRNIDVWEPLVPGEPDEMSFQVGPLGEAAGTVSLGLVAHVQDWGFSLVSDTLELGPEDVVTVSLTTTPPAGARLGSRQPLVDVEAYIGGELIGGFRKLDWPPVALHRLGDPFFAESEISVEPYPPRAGEPAHICAELRNLSNITRTAEVQFSWAEFGIGLPFQPINGMIEREIPPLGQANICTAWIPPDGGQFCVQAMLHLGEEYWNQFSQLNLDVEELLVPNESHSFTFPVGNHFHEFTNPEPAESTIHLTYTAHLPGWEITLEPEMLPRLAAGAARPVTLTVTPPDGLLPPDGTPIVDVRAYVQDGEEQRIIGGFRKIARPPIPLHRFPDPPYAEREISIHPYPPLAGEPAEVCVELRNPTPHGQTVEVLFLWAHLGIGLPFSPIGGPRIVHLPPHSLVNECIHWVPPISEQVCVRVDLSIAGYDTQSSQRNMDVNEPLRPGEPHSRAFPVGNPFERPVTITLGLIPHLEGWGLELSQDILADMGPGEIRPVTLTVTPPADLPADGDPIVDLEAFVEGELIGGFRKIFRPPVPIHRPQDPIYAESEIFVHPYPPRAREPTELGVEIFNPTEEPQTITVTFSFAEFGIGLPFTVIDTFPATVPDRGMIRPIIMWLPPEEGLWCIQVEIELPGHEEIFYSQRNMDVGEPLEPNTPHARPFPVGNPLNREVTITLGLIPHFPDWGLELSEDVLPGMAPGEVRVVVLTVTPPADLPGDGDPIVDVEAYAEGALIGGFRKIFRPPVPIHRPRDPIYAETEIGIDPYPVLPGQPTALSVEVWNPTEQDHVVTVTFSIARFGIGLPFSTDHIAPNPILLFVPAQGAARGHVVWEPPQWRGKFCVQVTLQMEGHDAIWSRRNIDVGEPLEPGQPHSLDFPLGGWPHTEPVTVTLGVINHREGWGASLSRGTVENIQPGEPVTVTLTVTPPHGAELGIGDPIVDVEAFVDGVLLGGFRKLDRPPIPLHKPHEKGYAESEISIEPYPLRAGEEARISTVVQNTSDTETTVELEFGWADFGMGIPFSTTHVTPITREVQLSPHMSATAWVTWTPASSGHYCVRIILRDSEDRYEPQESQRNVDVAERPPCGQTVVYTFTVYNDSAYPATVDIGLITFNVPANWTVTTEPSQTLTLAPYSQGVITVTVTIPCSPALRAVYAIQEEAGGEPTIDVEGYVDGELVGGIELRFAAREDEQPTIYLPIILKGF